ncbi:MAG: MFS transporter [Clostridiaceae bacterium]|nr:MFS transporter [Eubacteriales bacterium]
MKLNYKRTLLVGLAFFSICAFWQMYDAIVPLILRDTFHLGDTLGGFIMSIDNILAIFMLPLFGAFSDKAGRRMPFIILGTVAAVLFTVVLPITVANGSLLLFFVCLGLLLIAMATYRSPAVALMPDVTPKPLRSKANAVINLMGTLGGVYTLIATKILVRKAADGVPPDYEALFISVAGLMVVAVIFLVLTINERKLVAEMRGINYGVDPAEEPQEAPEAAAEKLPKDMLKSLLLILFSILFWFMGYNAVTTAFTKYATQVWQQDVGQASTCLMIATVGAVISYLPIGFLATKVGRKKTILFGIALLAACFALGGVVAERFSASLYVMFALVGAAWAAINVNSYPMVVEISRYGNIGKYTGYYYLFSMAAQIITPTLSGYLLEHVGYYTLFPYAAVMVALSFFTMLPTRHGDSKPAKLRSKLEAFDTPDGD